MSSLTANITCSFYIQGRIDASNGLPLREKQSNENDLSYLSYCNGYASLKAVLDYEHNVISNLSSWPIESQELYKTIMKTNEHVY